MPDSNRPAPKDDGSMPDSAHPELGGDEPRTTLSTGRISCCCYTNRNGNGKGWVGLGLLLSLGVEFISSIIPVAAQRKIFLDLEKNQSS